MWACLSLCAGPHGPRPASWALCGKHAASARPMRCHISSAARGAWQPPAVHASHQRQAGQRLQYYLPPCRLVCLHHARLAPFHLQPSHTMQACSTHTNTHHGCCCPCPPFPPHAFLPPAVTNLCRDEVTAILKDKIEAVFGGSFNTNGLGGVITCGVTGFGAGLSHAPVCAVSGAHCQGGQHGWQWSGGQGIARVHAGLQLETLPHCLAPQAADLQDLTSCCHTASGSGALFCICSSSCIGAATRPPHSPDHCPIVRGAPAVCCGGYRTAAASGTCSSPSPTSALTSRARWAPSAALAAPRRAMPAVPCSR